MGGVLVGGTDRAGNVRRLKIVENLLKNVENYKLMKVWIRVLNADERACKDFKRKK